MAGLQMSQEKLDKYVNGIKFDNTRLQRAKYAYAQAVKFGDPDPVGFVAQGYAESRFHNKAKSHKAASGVWQFIPKTAKSFDLKDPTDMVTSTDAALRYRKKLRAYSFTKGKENLVLAGYNAGEGSVQKYKGIPPYKETQQYVQKINASRGKVASILGVKDGHVGNTPTYSTPATTVRTSLPAPSVKREPAAKQEGNTLSLAEINNLPAKFESLVY